MRVAQVIGRVTLNVQDPSFKGGRWLMCNPLDAKDFNTAPAPVITPQPRGAAMSKGMLASIFTAPWASAIACVAKLD